MLDRARHEPLTDSAWGEARARDAIAAICVDLEASFDPDRLWPLDPVDEEPGTAEVVRGLYLGAAGMLHGLRRVADFYEPRLDPAAIFERLRPEPDEDDAGVSLLIGTTGILLRRAARGGLHHRRRAVPRARRSRLSPGCVTDCRAARAPR